MPRPELYIKDLGPRFGVHIGIYFGYRAYGFLADTLYLKVEGTGTGGAGGLGGCRQIGVLTAEPLAIDGWGGSANELQLSILRIVPGLGFRLSRVECGSDWLCFAFFHGTPWAPLISLGIKMSRKNTYIGPRSL